MMKQTLPTCPACKLGHLHPASRVRKFSPHGQTVQVELLTSLCDHCGVETTRAAQHKENLSRLAMRKVHYGALLMGEDILALRKRYGLTQQDASRIFGKGKIAFSRYENEVTYPDESTTLLLQLAIDSPSVMKSLADKANIEMPLWPARCEDEQRVKVRSLTKIYEAVQSGHKYQEQFVASASSASLGNTFAKVWSAPLVATRQTVTLPHASNDPQLAQQAGAA